MRGSDPEQIDSIDDALAAIIKITTEPLNQTLIIFTVVIKAGTGVCRKINKTPSKFQNIALQAMHASNAMTGNPFRTVKSILTERNNRAIFYLTQSSVHSLTQPLTCLLYCSTLSILQ